MNNARCRYNHTIQKGKKQGKKSEGQTMEKKKYFSTQKIVFLAAMAAIVCVVTFFRFPLLNSKVHFANAMCLLGGLLFGGVGGGLAAGVGSALYDALFGGYDAINCIITFVSKFLMAFICAKAARVSAEDGKGRIVLGCIAGAVSYVALYMLKTFIYQRFVYAYPPETVWATMLSKLPASALNAAAAIIAAPIIYAAVRPALAKSGLIKKLN
jgi:uncharacterized membrane protein